MKKRYIALIVILLLVVINISIGFIFGWDIAKLPWTFFSDQILGMKWLDDLLNNIINKIFGSDFGDGLWGNAIQFFIYDMIKIGLLLCSLIFIISYIQSFFPPEKTKKILSKYVGIKANITGALLGTVTPFCSCSSIPIFIGFTRAGVSSGVTFSFLISSPLVDLGSLMLLVSFFGWPIAIAYIIIGLILAVAGGTIIEKTKIGEQVEDIVKGESVSIDEEELTTKERLTYAKEQMIETYKKVFIYILVGVGIGCVIHNFIPEDFISNLLGSGSWYGVPLATVLGTPMYADIFGTIPIAEALYLKGAGLGTVLAFMMSVTALSIPSLIMLKKVCKPKLLATFIVIVVFGIISIGYLFNWFGYLFI